MKLRRIAAGLGVVLLGLAAPADDTVRWAAEMDIVESCCCNPICPCMVGSPPTRGHCHGNRLIEIRKGAYDGTDLGGVSVVVVFNIGNWTKLYIGDDATEEQAAALERLLRTLEGFVYGEVLEVARVPVKVERSDERVRFEAPASVVEIELMKGPGGEAIQVSNLRFGDYTQYKSVVLRHTADDPEQAFELSETNGFTAVYRAASD